ncbi:MAG: sigma-54 dependent transcriptional regulator [Desulfobacterota bacterium]|nr:sigma-54 dependent transcriptional regulator [Thermodesulfobacteriota bacterium]MDW8001987.1 sigma-54 dependent transcriptional regulator [Deltaproteobacteria bacterium]
MRHKILIIDDEDAILESLDMYFTERGYSVMCAKNAAEGYESAVKFDPDVIILDVRLPDDDGLQLLTRLKDKNRDVHVIIITAFHDMETTIKAVKKGAYEYIPKPIDIEELDRAVSKALRLEDALNEKDGLIIRNPSAHERGKIIGKSKAMKEIFKAIGILSENRVTVLIEGETGTGKELIAQAIHYNSPFRDHPFIPINCSAIVGTLLESELFGHEKGAFTGAHCTKRGKFELAGDGTIFLDEVSEIPYELQAKLLRFLQEKEFERVGGEKTLKSNARVIAASNRPLSQLVKEGKFREDLYYRLSVAKIYVPPLRERKSDIPLLVEYLIGRLNLELKRQIKKVEEKAIERMMEYHWPGNVRELENVLTRAAIEVRGEVITEEHILPLLEARDTPKKEEMESLMSLSTVEKQHIKKVLECVGWHFGKACEILGISRPSLRRKIREYGIERRN